MKRGDLILVREPNTPAGKPRPYVVVQRDSALDAPIRVTGCPLTSHLRGAEGQRPFVAPTAANGLRLPSEVQVDLIYTHPVERIDGVIGSLDVATMQAIDIALRRWLAL
ncbi:type II toxin-antitoxin system PemK/MazF family toxin [Sphingomonas sp.]|jgi:mRNA interferase MazF|uniref:type II toxin-antitoxin system PemK/MazF family toxin n=1 Tax=Sphingomonas sp. TaxID=28214 RepID=UPI002DEBD609|nr:type II toxin-antitoxin system PemK/MazF family toxin [Sphingomonas sp.]